MRNERSHPERMESGLAAWIDPKRAAAGLRELVMLPGGWRWRDIQIARVYPARPDGMGVQFDVVLASRLGRMAAGSLYLSSAAGEWHESSNALTVRPSRPLPLSALSIWIPDGALLLHTPDRDEKLPELAAALALPDSEAGGRVLETALRPHRILNYRPGRRCTIAYRVVGEPPATFVAGKLYRKPPVADTVALYRDVASHLGTNRHASVRVPRIVSASHAMNIVFFEWLETDGASGASLPDAAGRILAELHRAPCAGRPRFKPEDEIHATGRWVRLARGLGRGTPLIECLWTWLRRAEVRLPSGEPRLIHRDFYDSQLLRLRDGWAVLDLDTAAAGDPEQDVGNFIGHTIWDAVRHGRPAPDWSNEVTRFLTAYALAAGRTIAPSVIRTPRAGITQTARLRFYVASSLLRVGIIHSLRSASAGIAPRLHAIAAELIGLRDPSAARRNRFARTHNGGSCR